MTQTHNDSPGASGAPEPLMSADKQGHVLVIRLLRERKRNAINRAMADGLDAAMNQLDDDPTLRVGILYGGTNVFCAGSDLTAGFDYDTERGGEYGLIRRSRRKPLIAAVEGIAYGGGTEIVLACDLVVAASNARFALPEVTRGVLPSCGALFRTLLSLPPNIAREMVLTGLAIDAQRACVLGMVNRVVPPGESLAAALELAERISANAPLAVQASLAAMNSLLAKADAPGWLATATALAAIHGSADVQEGIRAFLEKRDAIWADG
jgi:enoyl-CoA hydratase